MCKLWRLLLMWGLVLALPVQGVAAATMLHCSPVHPALQTAWVTAPAADEHLGHGDQAAAQHQHHQHQHHGPAAEKHAGSCSACASCCNAAALPAMPRVPVPPALPQALAAAPAFRAVAFLTSGPDRPPRAVPA